jgi:hypothetical protein
MEVKKGKEIESGEDSCFCLRTGILLMGVCNLCISVFYCLYYLLVMATGLHLVGTRLQDEQVEQVVVHAAALARWTCGLVLGALGTVANGLLMRCVRRGGFGLWFLWAALQLGFFLANMAASVARLAMVEWGSQGAAGRGRGTCLGEAGLQEEGYTAARNLAGLMLGCYCWTVVGRYRRALGDRLGVAGEEAAVPASHKLKEVAVEVGGLMHDLEH